MAHDKYVAPQFKVTGFTCPLCDVYSHVTWEVLMVRHEGLAGMIGSGALRASCSHCGKATVWLEGEKLMIWPRDVSAAPHPNPDMPEDIANDYLEARSIAGTSPRGAAALLRLCIQKLCHHLGEPGKNINADIGKLVEKGLPVKIQQALDIVRVTGNNAVHPGEMQLQEDSKSVASLFELLNLIVENQISQPKAIDDLYGKLPEAALEGVKKRDANAKN